MSRLLDLQRSLQETLALIAQMERAIGPSAPPSEYANLHSLEKRRAMLERDFLMVADRQSRDVCSYRGRPAEESVR